MSVYATLTRGGEVKNATLAQLGKPNNRVTFQIRQFAKARAFLGFFDVYSVPRKEGLHHDEDFQDFLKRSCEENESAR